MIAEAMLEATRHPVIYVGLLFLQLAALVGFVLFLGFLAWLGCSELREMWRTRKGGL